ncbi:hypothetical protein HK102_012387 [Quaeritorhiza haematococci]|nr:hypothetical protein HK102_012387 [Quaeritorhiza haematococci]
MPYEFYIPVLQLNSLVRRTSSGAEQESYFDLNQPNSIFRPDFVLLKAILEWGGDENVLFSHLSAGTLNVFKEVNSEGQHCAEEGRVGFGKPGFFGKGAPSKGSKSQPSKKAVEKSDDAGASQDSGKKKRLVKAKNSKKRVASDSDEDFEQPTKSSYFESKPEPTNKKKKIAEDSDDAVEEIDPDSFFKTKPSGSKTQKGTRSQATPAKKSPAAATTKKKNEPEEKPKTQKAEPMVIDSEPEEIEEVLPANKAPTPPKKEASTAEKKSSAPRTLPWKKSGTSSVNKKDEAEKVEIKDSGSSSRKPAASPAAPKPKVNDSSAKTTPEKPATSPAAPEPKEKDSSAKTSPEKDAETDKKRKGGSGASQWFAKKARMDAGPKAPGSKEIPEGEENCLAGLTFVFTGELSSISREQAADLAKKYGGRVTSAPSSKTSYLVVGEDAGQSKLDKAKKLNLKTIDEDAFLDLIRTSKGKSEEDAQKGASKGKGKTPAKASTAKKTASASASPAAQPATKASTKATTTNTASAKSTASAAPTEQNLWTVKYAPKSYAEVIGNKAIVDKMAKWLQQWDKNLASGFKKGGKDDPSGWRCLLLSGPPGIGKTTAAHLVARLEGWEPVEFNASDTRSKNALDRLVRELTGSHTMTEYFTVDADDGKKGKNAKAPPKKRQVIIMDEVDGMSAGDRGGMAQLILLIKKTKVPIICICNDRQSTKVRSLANHCMDLRFRRPTEQQVENRIRAICQIEGLSLKPNVVGQLVQSTQADVRQILNMLSTYRLSQDSLSYDQSKQLAKASEKNVTLGPWDITGKLLGGSSFRNASTAEKIEYYFQDYQLIPLMIQENYAKMNPILAQELTKDQRSCALETLNLVSQAAESLSDSDLIEKALRGGNEWGLMPAHAVMSTVRPAFFMHGSGGGYGGPGGGGYAFPSWLGQNSKQNKSYRQLREVQIRMRLRISGDKGEVRQSYIPALAPILTEPLVKDGKDGVPDVIARMDDYYLGRDDWESVLDLSVGSYEKDKIMSKIPSAVKSNFTSSYNKRTHPTPFMSAQAASSKPVKLSAEAAPDLEDVVEADDMGDVDADEEHKSDEEDVATDRLIKQKKTASSGSGGAKASGSRKASSSSSKGRRK